MNVNQDFLNWLKARGDEGAYLFSTNEDFTYEDYLDYCEEMDMTPAPEDSDEYHNYVAQNRQDNYECDRDNCRCAGELKDRHFLITGTLGLWWGHPEIKPEIYDDFDSAIDRLIGGSDALDVDAHYDTECIYVNAHHHDGTNCFKVYLIRRGADIDILQSLIDENKLDINGEHKRFFEVITDFLY